MLGLAITRIGCFLNGCCFGKITASSCGVRYGLGHNESSYALSRQFEQLKMFITDHKDLFKPEYYTSKMRLIEQAIESYPDGILSDPARTMLHEMRTILLEGGHLPENLGYHMHSLLHAPLSEFPLPVHPTQLYACASGFVIFGFILYITRYRRFDGQIASLLGALYAVNRFTLEIFRSDNNTNLGLTISQWISIGILAVSIASYIIFMKKGELTDLPISEGKGEREKGKGDPAAPEDQPSAEEDSDQSSVISGQEEEDGENSNNQTSKIP
jgi:prolipoprotein diacylglyceryltransferase